MREERRGKLEEVLTTGVRHLWMTSHSLSTASFRHLGVRLLHLQAPAPPRWFSGPSWGKGSGSQAWHCIPEKVATKQNYLSQAFIINSKIYVNQHVGGGET